MVSYGESDGEGDPAVPHGESEDEDELRRRVARLERRLRAIQTVILVLQALVHHSRPESFLEAARDHLDQHFATEPEI